MNRTNFEHAGYALLMMTPFVLLGHAVAGAMFGIAFFLGREHAQVQRKCGVGGIQAFNPGLWSLDARLDFVFPLVTCMLALAGTYWLEI